jgi:hypothetical protein
MLHRRFLAAFSAVQAAPLIMGRDTGVCYGATGYRDLTPPYRAAVNLRQSDRSRHHPS